MIKDLTGMMPKTVLLAFIILASIDCMGQLKIFYDVNSTVTDSIHSYYYQIRPTQQQEIERLEKLSEPRSNRKQDTIWQYYTSTGKPKSKAVRKGLFLNGLSYKWSENGRITEKTSYDNGRKGYSLLWYPTGVAQATLEYQEIDQIVTTKIINYWDSTGRPLITNGTGTCHCQIETAEGSLFVIGKLKAGVMDSIWSYSKNKNLLYTEKYRNGVFEGGTRYANGSKSKFSEIRTPPQFKGGLPKMMEFFKNVIKYPMNDRRKGIEGKVFVQFTVTETGSIEDEEVIKGVSVTIDREALRVMKKMPDWSPGTEHGMPKRQRFVVPMNFALK